MAHLEIEGLLRLHVPRPIPHLRHRDDRQRLQRARHGQRTHGHLRIRQGRQRSPRCIVAEQSFSTDGNMRGRSRKSLTAYASLRGIYAADVGQPRRFPRQTLSPSCPIYATLTGRPQKRSRASVQAQAPSQRDAWLRRRRSHGNSRLCGLPVQDPCPHARTRAQSRTARPPSECPFNSR